MRYRTDARANDAGRDLRFHAEPRDNLSVTLDLPPWIGVPDTVRDPLGAETFSTRSEGRRLSISIPRIETLRLLWIARDGTP